MAKGASQMPPRGPVWDYRWWAVTVVSGLGAYLACSHGLLFYGGTWQIPLFVGCVVGLVAVAPAQAALASPGITLVLMALLPPTLPFAAKVGPLDYALAVALSVIGGAGVAYARAALSGTRRKNFGLVVSAGLVLWVLVNFWIPIFAGGLPSTGYGALPAPTIAEVPQPGAYVNDDAIYRRTYYLMHQGQPYYSSFTDAWNGLQQKPAPPNSVTAVRLPTFYWLWRLMPADLFSIVYLFLALCSVGVVAGALIAGQLVGARFAPLAAAALAAYAMGVGFGVYVTYIDLPVTCVALAGVALFVRSQIADDRRALWAAAGVLALAALTREILAYLIILAALSALLEGRGRRLRAAVPWLVALGVFAVGYVAHSVAVWPYISPNSGQISYLKGGPAFVLDAFTRFTFILNGQRWALIALFVAGVLGAYAARRRTGWPFSAFALTALLLPMIAMLRIGNPGIEQGGGQVNYWGTLVVPFALALWPAWALLLRGAPAAQQVASAKSGKRSASSGPANKVRVAK